jgi:hypothetical protein
MELRRFIPGTFAANCLQAQKAGRKWCTVHSAIPSGLGSAWKFAQRNVKAGDGRGPGFSSAGAGP